MQIRLILKNITGQIHIHSREYPQWDGPTISQAIATRLDDKKLLIVTSKPITQSEIQVNPFY